MKVIEELRQATTDLADADALMAEAAGGTVVLSDAERHLRRSFTSRLHGASPH
jgi:hypothetical protein